MTLTNTKQKPKYFKVLICGANLVMRLEGVFERMGFYTTRFVLAANSSEAGAKAINLVMTDSALQNNLFNEPLDPPIYKVEEVEEYSSRALKFKNKGYTFYREDSH